MMSIRAAMTEERRAGDPLRATPRRLGDFTADRRMLLLALMAVCVGTFGAAAALVLVKLIALTTNLVWYGRVSGTLVSLAHAARTPCMVVVPVCGGLVVGLMARYGSAKIRGHGIPEAIETILIGGSRIDARVAILKPLSSAIAIGTGGPFGAEGPIIMTGGALGSLFAQAFALSAAERKTLLVAGAAAGMTAIFGTPIAAVLLAVELLLFEWKPRSFVPVAVAALVAILWRPLLFGPTPLFAYAPPALAWWSVPLAGALGILMGLASSFLTLALYRAEDLFHRLPVHWMWWPALGGIVVGVGGLVEPRALGVGYDVIADLLANRLTLQSVLLVLAVKAVIWLVALASGTSGGVLAPLLILGGAIGWCCGLALPGDPGFWALVGMAAMLGGSMRAPLTGTIFAVELTGHLAGLPSLLAASICAFAVTVLLLKRSILTEKIARRGRHITQEYSIDPYGLTRAVEIMVTDVATLRADTTIAAATAFLASSEAIHRAYPVVDASGRLVGLLRRAAALEWTANGDIGDETLGAHVSDASLPVAHPGDVVSDIVDLMIREDCGLVPIVAEAGGKLQGIITRKDVFDVQRAAGLLERERLRGFARARPAVPQ